MNLVPTAAIPAAAPHPRVLAQDDDPGREAREFFDGLGEWLSEAWTFAWANFGLILVWGFIFFALGGGQLLIAAGRSMRLLWPGGRRKIQALRQRLLLEQQREAELNAKLDAEHATHCRCGERCDGREECEQHHPQCNCDHEDSFCVRQDEEERDCECRCDCKECDGYYKQTPLRRIPHSSSPAADLDAHRAAAASPKANVSWSQARTRFLKLSEDYATYECDPYELVRLPALADVTFGPTAVFIEAFYQANQLLTDTEPTEPLAAQKFIDAAEKAGNAWRQAVEAAERVRDTRLGKDERVLLRRAGSSLHLATNAGTAGERASAHETAGRVLRELAARTEASGRWRLPDRARLEIESWSRPELTAGGTAGAD